MAEPTTIFVVTYNFDFEESAYAFPDRAKAVAHVAETFECESTQDSPAFWREVFDNYGAGNWKGFAFYTLDPKTLAMKEADHG